ncbi:hypothetical protein CSC03_1916 [Enterobacter hormaechei]|nr:hypothetical protein CSC03_1916 [Enterobacter hormaechei]
MLHARGKTCLVWRCHSVVLFTSSLQAAGLPLDSVKVK